jgi:hypothetical protein
MPRNLCAQQTAPFCQKRPLASFDNFALPSPVGDGSIFYSSFPGRAASKPSQISEKRRSASLGSLKSR